jgi:magnesium transporter
MVKSVSTELSGVRAWLYDTRGIDGPVGVTEIDPATLQDNQILWVDVDLDTANQLDELWDDLGVLPQVSRLESRPDRPSVLRHENLIQLNIRALRETNDHFEPVVLHCLLGENWVATIHDGKLDLVDEFNEPLANESRLGELDAPSFLSVVVDWHLTGYFRAIEQLQSAIDRVDEKLLVPGRNRPELLKRLYELRRQATDLRLTLSPHRDVLVPLSNPYAEGLSDASDFQRLLERLESALAEVNTAREMVAVSFDIYMAQTAQETNEIMKRLTLASVLLLPAAVIAGIMGMNFEVGLFELPWMFWITLLFMAVLAGGVLLVARRRNWL